ncbi:hypothetical protein CY34DRAFT_803138 [Suillus luteus UH-Slu-Lm8-n1]|uniref:Uncharacterized protein n=1 Tax=Suillus luteus UH-Slu-Lm8-n1 TaxID=930992 RepID=A0A0D0B1Y7_9AGAM|nr:hypothetical protein CY34DRAFT_803138 [Suillus luteus UH-Slu-Lm8-n1]
MEAKTLNIGHLFGRAVSAPRCRSTPSELLRSTVVHLNDHSDEDDFVNTHVFPPKSHL